MTDNPPQQYAQPGEDGLAGRRSILENPHYASWRAGADAHLVADTIKRDWVGRGFQFGFGVGLAGLLMAIPLAIVLAVLRAMAGG